MMHSRLLWYHYIPYRNIDKMPKNSGKVFKLFGSVINSKTFEMLCWEGLSGQNSSSIKISDVFDSKSKASEEGIPFPQGLKSEKSPFKNWKGVLCYLELEKSYFFHIYVFVGLGLIPLSILNNKCLRGEAFFDMKLWNLPSKPTGFSNIYP